PCAPGFAEQRVTDWWLGAVRAQAVAFLGAQGRRVSDGTHRMLAHLAAQIEGLGESMHFDAREALLESMLLEAGFTGERKDSRGYRICYSDGKRVPCPKAVKPAKEKPRKLTAKDVADHVAKITAEGLTAEKVTEAAKMMASLTVKELGELNRHLKAKA